MNWLLMIVAIALAGFIGASVPFLLFGQSFKGPWGLAGMLSGFFFGAIIHYLVKRSGYIE